MSGLDDDDSDDPEGEEAVDAAEPAEPEEEPEESEADDDELADELDDDESAEYDDVDDELNVVDEALSHRDQNARALAIRRAIEERLEAKRLSRDLDYLDLDLDSDD